MPDVCSREPLVTNALSRCSNNLETLESTIGDLLLKITPILSSDTSKEPRQDAKCASDCEVASKIDDLTDRIDTLRENIADVCGRVEV